MAIGNVDRHADTLHKANGTTEPDADFSRIDISKLHVTLTESPKALSAPGDSPVRSEGRAEVNRHRHSPTIWPSRPSDLLLGGQTRRSSPTAPLAIDPASSCLQYSSNVFEGLPRPGRKARLFRPELNMRRLQRSAARLALPSFDGEGVLELIKRLVNIEKRWIPSLQGHSLYIRTYDHRHPGRILATARSQQNKDTEQVLWLFGDDKRVTEAGGMNFFVVVKRDDGDGYDLITAPLDGTILPGVTRASCLTLASDPAFKEAVSLNLHPIERNYTMDDLFQWSSQGKLVEALCIGTAAIVAAVNKIGYEGKDIKLPDYEAGLGPVGMALREKLLAIQEGRDEYEGWSVVCE
ncbi:aminotransferase [Melanogaster broomeanus]|nr:aminotransferase [Melanogaster broomeanus]